MHRKIRIYIVVPICVVAGLLVLALVIFKLFSSYQTTKFYAEGGGGFGNSSYCMLKNHVIECGGPHCEKDDDCPLDKVCESISVFHGDYFTWASNCINDTDAKRKKRRD